MAAEYLVALMASNCNTFSLLLYGSLVLVLVFLHAYSLHHQELTSALKTTPQNFQPTCFTLFKEAATTLLCEKTNKTSVDLVHIQASNDKLLYCKGEHTLL